MRIKKDTWMVLTCWAVFIFSGVLACPAEEVLQWLQDDIRISEYQSMYLDQLDMRGLRVSFYDDEEEEYDEEALPQDVYESMGDMLYFSFRRRFQGILAFDSSQTKPDEAMFLTMRIRLKSDIQLAVPGLLTKMLIPSRARETPVTMECIVYRSGSPDPIFQFRDSQPWALVATDEIWSIEANKAGFEAVVDRWARTVAQAFADRKIQP